MFARLLSTFFLFTLFQPPISAQITVANATCENRVNPTGIPLKEFRLGWELVSEERNQVQAAYHIMVASSREQLLKGTADVWNSKKIHSAQSILVNLPGVSLKPAQRYYWRVRVWNQQQKASAWSGIQEFTTGIFDKEDWKNAQWIGYEQLPDSMRIAPGVHSPLVKKLGEKAVKRTVVPLFRKEFVVRGKVKQAIAFITGLGHYEMSLNGEKTGNAFLAPGWTYYDKTVLYNSCDITPQLKNGANTIGVIVGNGFYNINRERYFKLITAFGAPKMICRIKLVYENGSEENIVSNESWTTHPSPVTFSSIFGGEDYNAQLEQTGWNMPGFSDAHWKKALLVTPPKGKLLPEEDYPLALTDTFSKPQISTPQPGVYMYDFKQNASGILQLKVKGKKGQTVQLIPAELINQQQLANQRASGSPYTYSYTLQGNGEEIWQPMFTYYGFRYVQVVGAVPAGTPNSEGLPEITQLSSLHNRNANPANGTFECSNLLFNQTFELINWAIKSNMQSVVTDCPHREKLSWLEQDYLMGGSIHYNFDIYSLYKKLVNDLIDAQYPQGLIPDIAPELVVFDGGFLDSPEWGSAAVILPWLLYNWYGDSAVLKKAYPMMKKYVGYLESKAEHHILSHGLGDWYDYGPKNPGEAQLTPKAVTATAIYYYDAVLLGKMSQILGYKEEETRFSRLAEQIKTAFNQKFFNPVTNTISTGSQTAMAMPLYVGLVPENAEKKVLQNLIDSIYANNKALTAGDIGFNFLVKALDAGGASQLIYDMNHRNDVAGYGFQLKKGATSLTESWNAWENVSNNHLMLGHIMEWFYSGLAGISQEENSIAYKHIRIRPQPVGTITHAKGSFHTPYGWTKTEWKKEEKAFVLDVEIPANTQATIYLPAGNGASIYLNGKITAKERQVVKNGQITFKTGSGKYRLEVRE